MRSVGIHQGLAPVLDVARDMRWGRTEETIGEDPYLVGSIGTAYVRGLQSAGIQATARRAGLAQRRHQVRAGCSRHGSNPATDGAIPPGPAPACAAGHVTGGGYHGPFGLKQG